MDHHIQENDLKIDNKGNLLPGPLLVRGPKLWKKGALNCVLPPNSVKFFYNTKVQGDPLFITMPIDNLIFNFQRGLE